MTLAFALEEQKDFVSCVEIPQKSSMRTLGVTLFASFAGWVAGILAGTVGGLPLLLTDNESPATWNTMSAMDWSDSETALALLIAIAMLPSCVLLVGPLVFCLLRRPSFWRLPLATLVGGMGGMASFLLWMLAISLANDSPVWTRPDIRSFLCMPLSVACVAGATTGCAAAWAARFLARRELFAAPALSPPEPYDY